MIVKLTRERFGWMYRTEDGTLVDFARCTLGRYAGKLYMRVFSERNENQRKIMSLEYLLEVTKEIKFYNQDKAYGNYNVRILEIVEVDEKKLSYCDVFHNMARAALFSIDKGKSYSGYTFNERWNGWECPYFTKEVAEEICRDFSFTYTFSDSDGNKQECRYFYNEELDTFYGLDENNECTEYEIGVPVVIQTPDGKKKVYDFSIAEWPWGEDK